MSLIKTYLKLNKKKIYTKLKTIGYHIGMLIINTILMCIFPFILIMILI